MPQRFSLLLILITVGCKRKKSFKSVISEQTQTYITDRVNVDSFTATGSEDFSELKSSTWQSTEVFTALGEWAIFINTEYEEVKRQDLQLWIRIF